MRLLAALLLSFLSALANAHVGPHPEAGIEFEQHLGAPVPIALPFVDGQGQRAALAQRGGVPIVLVLGYLQCRDLCAMTLPGVAEALDHAGLVPGRDYRAVFASIDAREPPAVLAQGAGRIPAADRGAWRFVGGDADSAAALAGAVGFRYRYEPERDAFAHPAGFVVLTPEGIVSRYFFGVRFEPRNVGDALAQAARGSTGSMADRLLLLCYHFDPATGRYSLAILDALRWLIASCAVGLGLWAWRRRRAPVRGSAP